MASTTPADGSASDDEQPCLGYVLYAPPPPRAVPRAQLFPTGPVSADAVLLTSIGIESGQADELPHALISQVVNELVRRGVRASRRSAAPPTPGNCSTPPTPSTRRCVRPSKCWGDCSFDQCMISADFLLDVGFTVVAPHRYFPRLRLELDKGLGWKAEVEAALERLLESAQLQQPVGAGAEVRG